MEIAKKSPRFLGFRRDTSPRSSTVEPAGSPEKKIKGRLTMATYYIHSLYGLCTYYIHCLYLYIHLYTFIDSIYVH